MWKPPERIDFRPGHGRVPTRAEATASRLFSPIALGPVRLAQRTWVPAMVPWRATGDGLVTEAVLDWYARFARGEPGAIVVEATGIRDIPSGPLLRIGHDRFIPGLARLAQTVRQASGGRTRLFIQILDFLAIRRRPEPGRFFDRFLTITPAHRAALAMADAAEAEIRAHLATLAEPELARILSPRDMEALRHGARERVTDTHLPHIRDLPAVLPETFAAAARRAREAGFDGVELHYAHAYTMASFLSATNTREDGYGATVAGRLRLPLEVYEAARAAVGRDMALGCRFLAEETIASGTTLADAVQFGLAFARAGMDFLSTSRGGKFDDAKQPGIGEAAYPYTGPSGYECMPHHLSDARGPFGRNAAPTAAIRAAIREAGLATPVVCTGGIHNFETAEGMLTNGVCDIVGAARQALADPDWTRKTALGLGAQVRLCEYTNYCEGLDQKHKTVTCKLWDRIGLDDPAVKRTADGKRRLTAPEWSPHAG